MNQYRIWLKLVIGIILWTASLMKLDVLRGSESWHNEKGSFAILVFEFILGWGLICGLANRWIMIVVRITFLLFGFVAGWNVVTGRESCGCFGDAPLDPTMVLLLDGVVLAALWVDWYMSARVESTRRGAKSAKTVHKCLHVFCVTVVGILLVTGIMRKQFARSNRNLVHVLNPGTWIGKPLTLLEFEDRPKVFSKNSWNIVLFQPRCTKCKDVVSRYATHCQSSYQETGQRIGFIELPNDIGSDHSVDRSMSSRCPSLKLPTDRRWFVETPVEIALLDGVVLAVRTARGRIYGDRHCLTVY